MLVVDDENIVLRTAGAVVRGLGRVVLALGALKAIEQLECQEFDVIVTDMAMPGMDGIELLVMVKERWPNTLRVMMSGHTLDEIVLPPDLIHAFIAKPGILDIRPAVLSLLSQRPAPRGATPEGS